MHRPPVLRAVVLAVVVFLGAACSDEGSDPSATTSTTSVPVVTGGEWECAMTMPGEVLTATQAVVEMDAGKVCPAYVLIAAPTAVTWRNRGTDPVTVTVLREYPRGEPAPGAVVAEEPVPAGDAWARDFDRAGTWYFQVSSVPTFVGTVQVDPGGS